MTSAPPRKKRKNKKPIKNIIRREPEVKREEFLPESEQK